MSDLADQTERLRRMGVDLAERLRRINSYSNGVITSDLQGFRLLMNQAAHHIDSQAARIAELEAELEATRQAWVDGEAPDCEEVCMVACKGPCGVNAEAPGCEEVPSAIIIDPKGTP